MISNRQFHHRTWYNFRTQPQPKTLYSSGNEHDKSGGTRKSSFHFLSEWNRKTFEQTSKVKILLGLWLPKTISHFRRGRTPPFASTSFSFQLILVRLGCLLQKSKKSKHSLKSLSLPAKMKRRARSLIKVQPPSRRRNHVSLISLTRCWQIQILRFRDIFEKCTRVYGSENWFIGLVTKRLLNHCCHQMVLAKSISTQYRRVALHSKAYADRFRRANFVKACVSNALHTALSTNEFFISGRIVVAQSTDSRLFSFLKNHSKGHHFGTLDNVREIVTEQFKFSNKLQHCFREWKHRLWRCIGCTFSRELVSWREERTIFVKRRTNVPTELEFYSFWHTSYILFLHPSSVFLCIPLQIALQI